MIQIRSLVFQVLFITWTSLVSVFCVPVMASPDPRRRVAISAMWCRVTLWLLKHVVGLSFTVVGEENRCATPAIYAIKHQSAWETIAVCGLFAFPAIILKRELMYIPVFGLHLRRMGFIGIDRSAGASALKNMVRDARAAHAAGRDIIMFPEGTRTPPGQRRPYHPGIAALYRDLEVPVVPVALNSGVFWGRRKLFKQPGRITVQFLPPIEPGLARREFMAALEDSIERATKALVQGVDVTDTGSRSALSTVRG